MEAYEVTRIVFSRVQGLDPENVSKVMGYLLLQDQGDHEMLRLAYGPDVLLQALVTKAKKELGLPMSSSSQLSSQLSPQQLSNHSQLPLHFSAPSSPLSTRSAAPSNDYVNALFSGAHPHGRTLQAHEQLRSNHLYGPQEHAFITLNRQDQLPLHEKLSPAFEKFPLYHEHNLRDDLQISERLSFLNDSPEPQNSLNFFPNDYLYAEMYGGKVNVDPFQGRSNGRQISPSELSSSPESGISPAWKPCLYYARGYCKHGSSCRFLHSHFRPDPVSPLYATNGHDSGSDDGLLPGSLERLELELRDLLRARRAPVSIASLPQLYYERYGKTLQAEGYLTESQRHGKAGYSLAKLLARLKNTVTLIDRREKDDLREVNPGSRQIYLTFPAESTFSEDDVSAYFRMYGPVQDVRIPYQQKRMFGFVTFVYPETVKAILAKGNPHYICGARVLVKPYREKGKHNDRKLPERADYLRNVSGRSLDGRDYDFSPGPSFFDGNEVLRRQFEVQEQTIELERSHLMDLQSADMPRQPGDTESSATETGLVQHFNVSNGLSSSEDFVRATEDMQQLQTSSAFGFLLDVLDGDPGDDLELQERGNSDQERDEHNLPDSPFASPRAHGKVPTLNLPEKFKNLTLGVQAALPTTPVSVSAFSETNNLDLTCHICMDFPSDPIQLDCNHLFCVQCILKVIRVSKDECPICNRHIGSQIAKLLESRGLQVIDPSLAKRGGSHNFR